MVIQFLLFLYLATEKPAPAPGISDADRAEMFYLKADFAEASQAAAPFLARMEAAKVAYAEWSKRVCPAGEIKVGGRVVTCAAKVELKKEEPGK